MSETVVLLRFTSILTPICRHLCWSSGDGIKSFTFYLPQQGRLVDLIEQFGPSSAQFWKLLMINTLILIG